ncbi:sugar ABC transporter ATP-binding protein [Pseudooceanicola nitratireducens]|uniref:sugar ABC transporter ATP-binding protein n=1 Tax=Pseudooceanicola nitratireducens TaxID=517719 RepID=UPI001C96A0ED|nr:sugar ABC transporter ATP-binding protein [Pseudooceanicola nitratireducens]MBY6167562.1 sugar ABC transporter ATP-binding protein [Pseudooceanicola nitratireducens]
MPQLTMTDMYKAYGATVALKSGQIALHPGELHVIMGANGSGKSTLCKILAGSVKPDGGRIELDGKEITISGPKAARDLGVSIFYQELSLSKNRSVAENILARDLPCRAGFVDRKAVLARAEKIFAPFRDVAGDDFDLKTRVGNLRPDQRQLVEIAKTFAGGARIFIFDEPTSALDRAQTEAFFRELDRRKAEGASIVFISHRMEEVFEIGDRVTVIRDGETVSSAPLAETTRDSIVAEMVGGETGASVFADPPAAPVPGPEKLRVQGLTSRRLRDVSFTLHAGEVLGLGGLHGQGQSDLLRALFGLEPLDGTLTLDGAPITLPSPRRAIRQGFGYISGDRQSDGAISGRSIFENVVPIHLFKTRAFFVNHATLSSEVDRVLAILATRHGGRMAPISSLSGGNQQKVIISRWLMDETGVLLLDDPTKGIDLATKLELFALIRSLADKGMAILLYSSEDAELLANSDRILVFNNGAVVQELQGNDRTRTQLTRAAFEAA